MNAHFGPSAARSSFAELPVFDGGNYPAAASAVEDRKLGKGTAWTLDRQNLLSARRRQFEDANFSGRHEVQPRAWITFGEELFVPLEASSRGARHQCLHFRLRETREQRSLAKDAFDVNAHCQAREKGSFPLPKRSRRQLGGDR